MKTTLRNAACVLLMGLCAVACSDDEKEQSKNGQGVTKNFTNLNVSAYDQWTYINLQTGQTETHPDTSEWIYTDGSTRAEQAPEKVSIDWHIAIHRYEVRTNGGSALSTEITDLNNITALPEGNYTTDETIDNEDDYAIITDMTHMMDNTGKGVAYSSNATINRVLCGWVDKQNTGSMPPIIYTPNKKVLIVKFPNGEWAKLQFTIAGNSDTGKSGFVTFNSEFIPLEQ